VQALGWLLILAAYTDEQTACDTARSVTEND